MKVTFIDPPDFLKRKNVERIFGCTYTLYPMPNIFSLTMAAVLEKSGHSVNYIDMANEGWSRRRFEKFLAADDSSIYCFHSVNLSMASDLNVLEMIRGLKKNALIVFTGPAPTYFIEEFLKTDRTFVIRGEPEFTLLEFAQAMGKGGSLTGIKGLSFLLDNRVVHNDPRSLINDLDELPYPARHLLRRHMYYNPKLPKQPFTATQTSRNCSYGCIFCVPNSYNFARELEFRRANQERKPPVRMRSARNVIEEFKNLKEDGYRSISIIDDQFLWDESRTIDICNGIKDLGIEWGCLARADHITDRIAKTMAAAHCRYVDMGVESFDQNILDDIGKNLKSEKIYEAVGTLKKYKILAKINLILGASILHTPEKMREDIMKAKSLDVDSIMFSIATPFPGTEFYRRARQNNWISGGSYRPQSVQQKAIIEYPRLSGRELDRIARAANISFFLSPKFIKKNLHRIAEPLNLYRGLVALKRKFI